MLGTLVSMFGSLISTSISSVFVTSSLPWQTILIFAPALSLILLPFLWILLPSTSAPKSSSPTGLFGALHLFSIPTYLLVSIGTSLGGFYMKSYLFWSPSYLLSSWSQSSLTVYNGTSYPAVITTKSMFELLGTLSGLPLLVWIAEQFHFGFLSFRGSPRAIPLVVALTSAAAAAAAFGQLYFASRNYTLLLVSAFLNSFMGASGLSLANQMLLTVCPADQRTAAMSMLSLISSVVTLPAEQIIGKISDVVRADSDSPQMRFLSLEVAMLANWLTMALAGVSNFIVVFFYPRDRLRIEMEEKEGTMEKKPLLSSVISLNLDFH